LSKILDKELVSLIEFLVKDQDSLKNKTQNKRFPYTMSEKFPGLHLEKNIPHSSQECFYLQNFVASDFWLEKKNFKNSIFWKIVFRLLGKPFSQKFCLKSFFLQNSKHFENEEIFQYTGQK